MAGGVLDNENGGIQVPRQPAEQLLQGFYTAGRCADDNNVVIRHWDLPWNDPLMVGCLANPAIPLWWP